MKKIALLIALAAVVAGVLACIPAKNDILEIGAEAPMTDRKMEDISGKEYALADLKKDKGLLVVFSCNTCPFVVGNKAKDSDGWQGRYNEIHKMANAAGFGMVLVNSNEAYRDGVDSKEEMRKHAAENDYTMPYVIDQDHELADAFGALTTPHIYLFDKEMKLVYKGAIDDNVNSADEVSEPYLSNALKNASRGQKIDPNSTKQLGCSIKRVKS